jgi:hypothetical protein
VTKTGQTTTETDEVTPATRRPLALLLDVSTAGARSTRLQQNVRQGILRARIIGKAPLFGGFGVLRLDAALDLGQCPRLEHVPHPKRCRATALQSALECCGWTQLWIWGSVPRLEHVPHPKRCRATALQSALACCGWTRLWIGAVSLGWNRFLIKAVSSHRTPRLAGAARPSAEASGRATHLDPGDWLRL